MKKAIFLLTALLVLSGSLFAATTNIDPTMNLGGVWTNPENPSWNILFSQEKNDVVVICHFYGGPNNDTPVIWHGIGTAKNGKVEFTAVYTVCPSNWEPTAKISLDVRENMMVLVGTSTDSKGHAIPLKFVRKVISKAQVLPTPTK